MTNKISKLYPKIDFPPLWHVKTSMESLFITSGTLYHSNRPAPPENSIIFPSVFIAVGILIPFPLAVYQIISALDIGLG